MSLTDSARSVAIVSGSSKTTFDGINKFTFSLPTSGYRSGRDEVTMKSLALYYSWPNISSAKGNNTFSYMWNGATFPVVIADGIWSFADLNSYLQQVMAVNGHYLLNASGVKQYYISLTVNSTLYCLSLVIQPIPTVLPIGWSNPAAVVLSGNTPQLIIPSNMVTLTGFAAATYPTVVQTTIYQVNSGIPQISDVTALNILCNLVDNSGFSTSSYVLSSFIVPSGQQSGSLMTIQPVNLDWVPIQGLTQFNEITLELVDQLRRPVTIRDPTGFVAILSLRARGKN